MKTVLRNDVQTDEERLKIVNAFLHEYYAEHRKQPAIAVIERLANYLLVPYTSDKTMEYKILSVYTLERHRSREQVYNEAYDEYYL